MEYVDVPLRVRYADTDTMGVVYYGTFPMYFEIGRSEFMREKGFTYKEFEEMGYHLVVTGMEIRYLNSACYDDLLTVRTSVSDIRSRGLTFNYRVLRDGTTVVEGKTTHVCVNSERKSVKIPSSLLGHLKHVGSG